tara:strand:- start:93 stop:407 length:315 start_codon:yes stop_codon:yes gene_type:complete
VVVVVVVVFFVRYKSVVKEKTYTKVAAGFIVRPFLFFFFASLSLIKKKRLHFHFPEKKTHLKSHLRSLRAFADRLCRSPTPTTLDESPTESVFPPTKKHSHKCR